MLKAKIKKIKLTPEASFIRRSREQYKSATISQKWQIYIKVCEILKLEPYSKNNIKIVEEILLR